MIAKACIVLHDGLAAPNFVSMVNKLNLKVLDQEEKFDRFLLPPEIKNDIEHLPEDFDYIREHLKTIVKTGRKK